MRMPITCPFRCTTWSKQVREYRGGGADDVAAQVRHVPGRRTELPRPERVRCGDLEGFGGDPHDRGQLHTAGNPHHLPQRPRPHGAKTSYEDEQDEERA